MIARVRYLLTYCNACVQCWGWWLWRRNRGWWLWCWFLHKYTLEFQDLCTVGIVVKAITLWGQKCQSSSRTIPQLLEISENCCSNCYRKNSLLWTWVHMCFQKGVGSKRYRNLMMPNKSTANNLVFIKELKTVYIFLISFIDGTFNF